MTTPFKMQGWSPFQKTSPLKQSYPSTSQFSGDYHVKWNPSGSKPNTWTGLKKAQTTIKGNIPKKYDFANWKPDSKGVIKDFVKKNPVSPGYTGPYNPSTTRIPSVEADKLMSENAKLRQASKQLSKKVTIKTASKFASRAIPVIGASLLAYDILAPGVKRIAEGIKTGVPQTTLTGKNIKNTFKRVPKKKYI